MGNPRYPNGWALTIHEDNFDYPLTIKRPTCFFTVSMGDLFQAAIPADLIRRVFSVIEKSPQHLYITLTKQSKRLVQLAPSLPWAVNAWIGVSVTSERYLYRADDLRKVPAALRCLSLEPLLEPLPNLDLNGIGWVIVGGESGPGARPMQPEWVREILRKCRDTKVPFFFKQWGGTKKKQTGHVLDGREYQEYPDMSRMTSRNFDEFLGTRHERCSEPGCVAPVHCKGKCKKHYNTDRKREQRGGRTKDQNAKLKLWYKGIAYYEAIGLSPDQIAERMWMDREFFADILPIVQKTVRSDAALIDRVISLHVDRMQGESMSEEGVDTTDMLSRRDSERTDHVDVDTIKRESTSAYDVDVNEIVSTQAVDATRSESTLPANRIEVDQPAVVSTSPVDPNQAQSAEGDVDERRPELTRGVDQEQGESIPPVDTDHSGTASEVRESTEANHVAASDLATTTQPPRKPIRSETETHMPVSSGSTLSYLKIGVP